MDYLKSRECRIIVIACNTATTRCRRRLMELYPDLIFVGTVPAVKVACDNNFKNTLVMATPATIHSERLHQIVDENVRNDQNIYLVPCYGLANAIERRDEEAIDIILSATFQKYRDKSIDSIVLGCTHYPFIKDRIAEMMPQAELLDGANGVARETRHQMEMHGLTPYGQTGNIEIFFSENNDNTKAYVQQFMTE